MRRSIRVVLFYLASLLVPSLIAPAFAAAQATGVFNGTLQPQTATNLQQAQISSSNSIIYWDNDASQSYNFILLGRTDLGYSYRQITHVTLATPIQGAGITQVNGLTYCYYNSPNTRINYRVPNSSGGFTVTNNIYTPTSQNASCATMPDGTVYLAVGDGSLQVATINGNTYNVNTVSGAPSNITNVVPGYNGNLLLASSNGTWLGKVTNGAWTGSLISNHIFYKYAAYQDSTGTVYLVDTSSLNGFKITFNGQSHSEGIWAKPFGVTPVVLSMNAGGTLLVGSATALQLQFPSALSFPAVAVGTADPVEELVLTMTAAGTLGSVKVTSPGGSTDFVDAGTGTCTTNGASNIYSIGDTCTIDVIFNPTRGGSRTGTATVTDASANTIATAALTGSGIGGVVDHLAFTTTPTSATVGTSFSATVTAYADAAGTTVATNVTGTTATVTSNDTAAVLPTGVTFHNGVATFSTTLNTQGSKTISLLDVAGGESVTSAGITVSASVNHLALTGLPATATAGTAISGTVTAYSDAGTTVATNYTGPVKITSSDTSASLPSNITLASGTGTFNITLKSTPHQTVTAADAGNAAISATSGSITVNAGAAAAIYAAMGSGQTAVIGTEFANPLTVQTVDAYGNPVGGVSVRLVIPTFGPGLRGGSYSCVTDISVVPAGSCTIPVAANTTTGSYSFSAQSGSLTPASFSLTNAPKTVQTITFNNPGAQSFSATPTLSATATSTLAVTFSSTTTGVCTITSGGALTFVSAGTCTINADQAGNATYAAATTVSQTFAVNAVVPNAPVIGTASAGDSQATVTFTPPANTGGSPILDYTVTSNPGLISSTYTGSPLVINGLTNGTSYTFTVTARNAKGSSVASAVSNSVTPKASQTIVFNNPGVQSFGTSPTISAASTSRLAVTFTSSTTNVCTVTSGGTLTFLTLGTCTINADQAGNTGYTAAETSTQSFSVQAGPQTITFNNPGTQSFGTTPTLSASASSGLPVAFTSNTTAVCTVTSGGALTFVSAGTCSVSANQAGSTNYKAATAVTRGFTVDAAAPGAPGIGNVTVASQQATVSFTAPANTGGAPITTYTVTSSPGNISASGTASPITVTGLSNGTPYTFTVTAGNGTATSVASAPSAPATPTGVQTITFADPGVQSFGTSPALSASSTSQLSVTFTSATPAVCTVTGSTLTFAAVGTCTINADQAGNSTYNPASTVQRSFTVQKGTPSIATAPTASAITYGQTLAQSTLTGGVASTQGTFAFTAPSTAPAAGTASYSVTFTPADTADFNTVTTNVSVQTGTASQTITFTQSTTPVVYGSATTIALSATGGASGNAVTFAVGSGPGSISGSTLTITGAGTVVINANQAGNDNYSAAATSQKSIVVTPANATLSGPGTQPVFVVFNQAGTVPVTIAGQYSGTGITAPSGSITYSITNATLATVGSGTLPINAGAVSVPVSGTLAPGIYTVTANYAGDTNYAAATALKISLQVGQIQPTINWSAPAALSYGAAVASALNAQAVNGSNNVPGTYAYLNGSTAVTSSTVLTAGSYTLTVNFTPTDTTTYKTATATAPVTVNKASSSTTLVSSASTLLVKNTLTLTATVASTVATPTGTVTFLDGSTPLGTASLNAGVATFPTSSLAVGAHTITATYAGDSNFTASATASATAVQVNDFDLTITNTGTSGGTGSGSGGTANTGTNQTVVPGGTANFGFTLTPSTGTFPAAVTLTVSGVPTGATYTITPSTIAAGSLATPVVLTVKLPSQTSMLRTGERIAPLGLAVLLLPFSGRLRRRPGRLSRLAAMLLLLLGSSAGIMALTGCGSSTGFFASPQTTYNVVITATSGSLSHSTTVTLTVQ